jgi:hypothetical protein
MHPSSVLVSVFDVAVSVSKINTPIMDQVCCQYVYQYIQKILRPLEINSPEEGARKIQIQDLKLWSHLSLRDQLLLRFQRHQSIRHVCISLYV